MKTEIDTLVTTIPSPVDPGIGGFLSGADGTEIHLYQLSSESVSSGDPDYGNLKKDRRHLTLGEIDCLLQKHTPEQMLPHEYKKSKSRLFGSMFHSYISTAYYFESLTPVHRFIPLWTNQAVKLKEFDMTVYSEIDRHKIRRMEKKYSCGYYFERITRVEKEAFHLSGVCSGKVRLEILNKWNRNLIPHLFGKEFYELSPLMRNARFVMPFDGNKQDSGSLMWSDIFTQYTKRQREKIVLPLGVHFVIKQNIQKNISNFKAPPLTNTNNFIIEDVYIVPYDHGIIAGNGCHFAVKK